MNLESMFRDLDPLLWAKRPKSQTALDLLTAGAKEGDSRMAEILAGHVRDGVCSESGKLLQRWDGLAWTPRDISIRSGIAEGIGKDLMQQTAPSSEG